MLDKTAQIMLSSEKKKKKKKKSKLWLRVAAYQRQYCSNQRHTAAMKIASSGHNLVYGGCRHLSREAALLHFWRHLQLLSPEVPFCLDKSKWQQDGKSLCYQHSLIHENPRYTYLQSIFSMLWDPSGSVSPSLQDLCVPSVVHPVFPDLCSVFTCFWWKIMWITARYVIIV